MALPHPEVLAAIDRARQAARQADDATRLRIAARCLNPTCLVVSFIILIDEKTPRLHPWFTCPLCRRSCPLASLTEDGDVEPIALRTPVH
jgi:hypothetical protein